MVFAVNWYPLFTILYHFKNLCKSFSCLMFNQSKHQDLNLISQPSMYHLRGFGTSKAKSHFHQNFKMDYDYYLVQQQYLVLDVLTPHFPFLKLFLKSTLLCFCQFIDNNQLFFDIKKFFVFKDRQLSKQIVNPIILFLLQSESDYVQGYLYQLNI
ncbi:hypothetical protein TTHERM_000575519 (macronuclear) [Tetrahymena thermophila SB210]|uniref:Uncharacterized protein n=1 Tax=Tetrahymena thermophila (strain SB210) TaxID=312017 RepID=W7X8P9_TETTS|nr:hypothetical protein TTHERM_000575519 [Tetrahymena thermophila SB210]EWS75745.1 hypothetical protein TTHERM_000575519 [Tetrahymena thermophila SB210]|eukprot:XP_012651667.1 hypothetical protein TTHERM_000575519 [Tetrahymena thermophila SB210]